MPDNALPICSPILAASAHMLSLSRAMDRDDHERASEDAAWLAERFWQLPESTRPGIAVQVASYAAVVRHDAALLAAWRPYCEGGVLDLSPYRGWLDAELALLQGDARTHGLIAQARALLVHVQDAGSIKVLEEHLSRLEAQLTPLGG